MRNTERGVALVLVAVTAIIFSVAAFAMLTVALSAARRTWLGSEQRLRAKFAAEAGLVWAMQRLFVDPANCFPANPDMSIDTDGPGPLPATGIDIIATPCPSSAMTLKAKVTY